MAQSRFAILATGLIMAACQTTSVENPPVDIDYGTPPSFAADSVKDYMGGPLKDSESARYRFTDLEKAYCSKGALSGGKVAWSGWVMPFTVNAKNSYGGYAGFQPYYARYEKGELIDVTEAHNIKWDFVPELGLGCMLVK